MKMKNIIIAVAALALGAAAGWFVGGLGNGERGMGNGERGMGNGLPADLSAKACAAAEALAKAGERGTGKMPVVPVSCPGPGAR